MENANILLEKTLDFVTYYGPKVLGAILIFFIGSWIIKKMLMGVEKLLSKTKYDLTLQRFFSNILSWSFKIILVLMVVSTLGIDITAFAAIIAAAGLAVGLALQGSLSNFAGGVLIMVFKPYKIGDLVEAQGVIGEVSEIDIFNTRLVSPDNKMIVVPNGAMANGNIINYTAEGKIRVDLEVGVSYDSDIKKTKEVLLKVLTDNSKVLQSPAPFVGVSQLADSSVQFVVRPYCKPADYWEVYFGTYENVKIALNQAEIEIPFPHTVFINK
ncbi:MAG: mechanosensitive ion channel family protein [Flavobacteriales bacterium]|nr:mechanosensitive ion channel family protein [Flavobacteriales bacterium]